MTTIFCQRDKHVVTVSSNQSKTPCFVFKKSISMAFAKMQKTGKLWSKAVVRGTLVLFVFLKLSIKRKMHPYMFGNSLRIVIVLNILSRNGRFSAKKRFSLYGHATFRRVLMTSQSKRPVTLGPLNFVLYKRGCVRLQLENVSLATASEDTIMAF